jgi:hypothetical protein
VTARDAKQAIQSIRLAENQWSHRKIPRSLSTALAVVHVTEGAILVQVVWENPIHLARIPSWMKIVCGNKSTKGRKARKPYQRIMNYEPRGGSSHPEYEFSERASSRSAAQLALPANATSDLWTRRVVVPVHPWPLPGCSAQVKVSSLCPRMLHYQPLSPLIRRA